MTNWRGVFPALTTKFSENLQLDSAAMEKHFGWQVESGVDGLITTGSLGEASTLTQEEKLAVAEIAVGVARRRLPVLATIAETSTAGAIRFAAAAAKLGVDGLMVLPGMQYVSDRREVVAHMRAVAAAVDLPIMLYSNPVAYRVDVDLLALEQLADVPNIVAIKESSDDVRRVTDIMNRFGDRYLIFAGVDNLALESFAMGSVGWIAGLVNAFPTETVAIYQLASAGRFEEAREIYRWFAPMLRLDVSTKLVQNIKLVEAMVGVGTEIVRQPRLPLAGAERKAAEEIVAASLKTRPKVPLFRHAA